jgi:hypothetical protein
MDYFKSFILWPLSPKLANAEVSKKMKLALGLSKSLAIILLFNLFTGCYYYKVTTSAYPQPGVISSLADMNRGFVVHYGTGVYYIGYIKLENDSIKGNYVTDYKYPYKKTGSFPAENSTNRYRRKYGDRRIINEVHLYVNNLQSTLLPGNTSSFIALKDIYRCDIYNPEKGSTTISWIFSFAGGCIAAPFIIIPLLMLFGASCPYIYVNTGDGFAFTGEIYSGAIYAPLERNDYLTLPRLVAENGNYKLKISNELEEIQYTNLTELIVIDHPAKSDVLVDKYGNYQTAVNVKPPLTATNFSETDILDVVMNKDSLCYYGVSSEKELPLIDGVIMTFDLPEGVASGKLFIRARNSLWLDNVYKRSRELFGGYSDDWIKKQNNADSAILMERALGQKLPLSVFIEKNGEWVFCDYYNMAGPMALKEDVIALDLKGIGKGPFKIKLESGSYFWEIDYVGLDYSMNIPVILSTVKIDKAITNEEEDVSGLLKYDDLKYYVQAETSNLADLSFPVPPVTDSKRTVILHSKGYYQIITEANGLPEIKKLKELREPGQFLEYSRDLMKTEIDKLSRNQ